MKLSAIASWELLKSASDDQLMFCISLSTFGVVAGFSVQMEVRPGLTR